MVYVEFSSDPLQLSSDPVSEDVLFLVLSVLELGMNPDPDDWCDDPELDPPVRGWRCFMSIPQLPCTLLAGRRRLWASMDAVDSFDEDENTKRSSLRELN